MLSRRASPAAYLALAAVSIFWGTTYLGIRIAIETLPPAFVIFARFTLSGSILLVVARMRGAHFPRGRELWTACACGCLILGIGNAAAVYAEQLIPSGLAGLFATLSPFWLTGFEAMLGGEPLHAPTIAGMVIGFAGTALLLLPGGRSRRFREIHAHRVHDHGGGRRRLDAGFAGAAASADQGSSDRDWRYSATRRGAFVYSRGCICAGAPDRVQPRSVLALLYLVVFGSIVGYSAFIFAMDRLPVAIVSIYPYINAVVAMGVGLVVLP